MSCTSTSFASANMLWCIELTCWRRSGRAIVVASCRLLIRRRRGGKKPLHWTRGPVAASGYMQSSLFTGNQICYWLLQPDMYPFMAPASKQFHLSTIGLSLLNPTPCWGRLAVSLLPSSVVWLQLTQPWQRHFCLVCVDSVKVFNQSHSSIYLQFLVAHWPRMFHCCLKRHTICG